MISSSVLIGTSLSAKSTLNWSPRLIPPDRDWETRQSYLRKKNPDLQEEEITAIVEQIDQERPQEADETQSIIDRIGEQVG